jgi:tripartite-type tricarboxylate transporter receptor subunit TctC
VKRVIRRLLLATAGVLCSLGAQASEQDYPNKPVRIIVGYVAGGGPDLVGRALGQKLSEILGQPFVVENRPGAGAVLATGIVAKSPADGYTLLLGETGQLVIAPFTNKNLPYNTLRDFAPVALVSSEPLLLVANAKLPLKSAQDLLRDARSRPGQIAYGSSGLGTIHHIAGEVLKAEAGIDLMHVPYKGSGQSVPAALAGDVPILVTSYAAAGAHVRAGTLTLLAVTSPQRLASAPNVPAIAEIVKDYDFQSEMGVLAPAGTPPAVIQKLTAAIRQAVESPDFLSRFKDTANQIAYRSPAEYTDNLKRNLVKYEKAVKVAKIQPE